jgi:hypothetical protein
MDPHPQDPVWIASRVLKGAGHVLREGPKELKLLGLSSGFLRKRAKTLRCFDSGLAIQYYRPQG